MKIKTNYGIIRVPKSMESWVLNTVYGRSIRIVDGECIRIQYITVEETVEEMIVKRVAKKLKEKLKELEESATEGEA